MVWYLQTSPPWLLIPPGLVLLYCTGRVFSGQPGDAPARPAWRWALGGAWLALLVAVLLLT